MFRPRGSTAHKDEAILMKRLKVSTGPTKVFGTRWHSEDRRPWDFTVDCQGASPGSMVGLTHKVRLLSVERAVPRNARAEGKGAETRLPALAWS